MAKMPQGYLQVRTEDHGPKLLLVLPCLHRGPWAHEVMSNVPHTHLTLPTGLLHIQATVKTNAHFNWVLIFAIKTLIPMFKYLHRFYIPLSSTTSEIN